VLAAERGELILRLLREGRFAAVGRMAELASTSVATIRRDLERMERAGLLRRVRGGAERAAEAPPEGAAGQIPFDERLAILSETKRRIASAAAALCADGDTVMIDGGSTTYPMAEFLLPRRLRVITNSFAIAQRLLCGFAGTVILTGGVLHPDSRLVLDPFSEGPFGNYGASKAFMGVYGLDETGATNTEELLIKAERSMIERARELVILADASKFGRRGSLFLCGFERITTVITDESIPGAARRALEDRGVRLIVV
jgi:DeoR family transcriptional regulator, ulaG and ulaABCDEF operon transcriptional repressor